MVDLPPGPPPGPPKLAAGVSPRVRMALHTATAAPRDGHYFAPGLHRLTHLLEAGSGGQVLISVADEAHVPESTSAVWDVSAGSVTIRPDAEGRSA